MQVEVNSLLEGLMVYWKEVNDASRYYVHLLIGNRIRIAEFEEKFEIRYQEIKMVECDRFTKTYSFKDLSPINKVTSSCCITNSETSYNYYVFVEAENKEGKIIETSNKILGRIAILKEGSYRL